MTYCIRQFIRKRLIRFPKWDELRDIYAIIEVLQTVDEDHMDIEILKEDRLRYWCQRIDIPEEAVVELAEIASMVRGDEILSAVFTEFHEKTAIRGEWHREWTPLPFDPHVEAVLGERTSMFYVLAYLAAVPHTEKLYIKQGYGMDVFRDTMSDFRIWLSHVRDRDGHWGFDRFMWIWLHLTGILFRIGRLQFILRDFEDGVKAFRQRSDGRLLLMADPEIRLRADGYAFGAGKSWWDDEKDQADKNSDDEGWLPVYEETGDGWKGNPVSPYGYGVRPEVSLPRSEWDLILQKGDTILDLHIPRKDPFTVEACADSYCRALAFFKQHWPEKTVIAGFCHTWFFTPQLQQILPAESNIVRFQREFYLYPHPGGPGFLWNFVFSEKERDLATAPRDTSLRRDVLDWLSQGKEMFDLPGLMFHGSEEWGSQPYMRAWDAQMSLAAPR